MGCDFANVLIWVLFPVPLTQLQHSHFPQSGSLGVMHEKSLAHLIDIQQRCSLWPRKSPSSRKLFFPPIPGHKQENWVGVQIQPRVRQPRLWDSRHILSIPLAPFMMLRNCYDYKHHRLTTPHHKYLLTWSGPPHMYKCLLPSWRGLLV